jgi:hypothetical protein
MMGPNRGETRRLDALSSDELARRLVELAGDERRVQVEFLLHLDAFDRRRAWLVAGYESLWGYCTQALHLREGAAGRRIGAMRALRRFPRLEPALRDGRLSLSTVTLLASLLTDENLDELVARAAYRTKADTERLVASLPPRREPREGLRLIGGGAEPPHTRAAHVPGDIAARATAADRDTIMGADLSAGVAGSSARDEAHALVLVPPRRPSSDEIWPLDSERWSIRVTLGGRAKADLDALMDLLSHKTGRDLGAVVHEAIRCALERHGKSRGAVAPSRCAWPLAPAEGPPSGSANRAPARAVPAKVKRQVWARDEGRCTYVSPDGRRCGSRWKLEFHHVDPAARGGPATAENITLRCKPHNLLAAERDFGAEHMRRFTGRDPSAREATEPYGTAGRRVALGPAP